MTSYSSKYIAKKKSEILLIKKMGKYEKVISTTLSFILVTKEF